MALSRQSAINAPAGNASVMPGGAAAVLLVGVALAAAAWPWLPSTGALLVCAVAYLAISSIVLAGLAVSGLAAPFGPANVITLGRAATAAFLAGFTVDPPSLAAAAWWWLSGLAGMALLFDGVDGLVARRSGCCSAFGARFDLEVDAAFALVLTILLWRADKVGPWILGLASLRYLFVLIGMLFETFRRPLPPRRRRRAICALQGALLCVALLPVVTLDFAAAACAIALAATATSFAIDIAWLASHRPPPH